MPSPAANSAFLFPACGSQRRANLIRTGVSDDFRPAQASRFPGAPAVKHGGGIPAQRLGDVPPDAQPVDLDDPAPVVRTGNGVPDDGDTEQSSTIKNAGVESPHDGWPAVSMVTGDKTPRLVVGNWCDAQAPVEHETAAVVVGDPSQFVLAKLLNTQSLQEAPRPGRVVVHVKGNLLVQTFAAGVEHEVMAPHLEDFDVLLFTAEKALHGGINSGAVRHGLSPGSGMATRVRGVGHPIASARNRMRQRGHALPAL